MRFTFALLVALFATLSSPGFADSAKPRVAVVVSSMARPSARTWATTLKNWHRPTLCCTGTA